MNEVKELSNQDKETRLIEIERNHTAWPMERKKKIGKLLCDLVDDGLKYRDLSDDDQDAQDQKDVIETIEAMRLDMELNF